MIPTKIDYSKFDIKFLAESDFMIYESDVNAFLEETGLTVQNIKFPLESDKITYIVLSNAGKTFRCGNILENIFLVLKKNIKNEIIVIDFLGVEEVSDYFLEKYTKFLLETSNKVLTINMSLSISNAFSTYIYNNLIEEE